MERWSTRGEKGIGDKREIGAILLKYRKSNTAKYVIYTLKHSLSGPSLLLGGASCIGTIRKETLSWGTENLYGCQNKYADYHRRNLDRGWTMEMAIPLRVFKGMHTFSPVEAGNQWAFLAIRQERNDAVGNRRTTSTIFPIYDIRKNVHQPNRFGLLEFVD